MKAGMLIRTIATGMTGSGPVMWPAVLVFAHDTTGVAFADWEAGSMQEALKEHLRTRGLEDPILFIEEEASLAMMDSAQWGDHSNFVSGAANEFGNWEFAPFKLINEPHPDADATPS